MEPNFFIAGAPKSATTNISYYLKEHPQVFFPELDEPYYFARFDVPKNYQREIISERKEYLSLFKNAKDCKVIGECSPVYLACPHAASEIKNEFPNSKILLSLRNPIEIAHSEYLALKFMGRDKRDFLEILQEDKKRLERNEFSIYSLLEYGFYSEQIKRFQKIFGSKKLKIIIFEEYIQNTIPTINSILSFLGIDEIVEFGEQSKASYRVPKNKISGFLLNNTMFRKTATSLIPTIARQKIGEKYFVKQTKKPPMLPKEREFLREIYEYEVKNLERLLSRRFPWPDFN